MSHLSSGQRQLGYSLVEIGIVLVALSFMVTGAMWSFSRQAENDRHDSTLEYMQALEDAVIDYAYANRTRGFEFSYPVTITSSQPSFTATTSITVQIAPGRPYLPCPDLDGDGLEDRFENTSTSVSQPTLDSSNATVFLIDLSPVSGRCVDNKGFFPFRTLRTKPADPWGNYFTYWVDANNFAHNRFGFDQTSKGSPVFSHVARNRGDNFGSPGADYAQSFAFIGATLPRGRIGVGSDFKRLFNNGYVLERGGSLPVTVGCADNCSYRLIAGDPISTLGDTLHTGVDLRKTRFQRGLLATSNRSIYTTRTPGNNSYPMVNGIAFAIVSHGANGHGAAAYLGAANQSAGNFICHSESNYEGELINARKTHSCPIKPDPSSYLNSCTSVPSFSSNCEDTERYDRGNGIFVTGTRTLEFDDIVTWIHPNELIVRLTRLEALPQDRPLMGVIPAP